MIDDPAKPWAIPLSLVHRLIRERQYDWPRRCPCGGDLDQRSLGLFDCRRCGRLLTGLECAAPQADKIVELAGDIYPYAASTDFAAQLTVAFADHARAMVDVKQQHAALLAQPDAPADVPPDVIYGHALGRDPGGGISVPIFQNGMLVCVDVVVGEAMAFADSPAVQVLLGDPPGDVIVAVRGLAPLFVHLHLEEWTAVGLHPDLELSLPQELAGSVRRILLANDLRVERRDELTQEFLQRGAEVRLLGGQVRWSDAASIRFAIAHSVDVVLDRIDGLPPVGSLDHEKERLALLILIGSLPDSAAARRDSYSRELARRTNRRQRDVAAEVHEHRERMAQAAQVIWPERSHRVLRLGQDCIDSTLVYTQIVRMNDGELRRQPVLVTGGREIIPFGDPRLDDLGIETPIIAAAQYPPRWSQGTAVPNSLPQFVAGASETSLATVVDELEETVANYLWFRSPLTYLVVALTVVATYCYAVATTVPYLFLFGFKRTGKTLLLEILERLCFNSFIGLPTRASLYRLTHEYGATVLLDEVRRSIHPDVLAVLKTGYRRGGEVIIVCRNRPTSFNTFGVKAFAGTKGYDDELLDRGILVVCERRQGVCRDFDVTSFEREVGQPMRDRLHCVALNNASKIADQLTDPATAGRLRGREREIFVLAAAIARAADLEDNGDRLKRLMVFAEKNEAAKNAVVTSGVDLPSIVEAVIHFCIPNRAVQNQQHTYVAADVTAAVLKALGKSKTVTPKEVREVGAELVRTGLLGTTKDDRPKLYVPRHGKSCACWILLPERIQEVAHALGVTLLTAKERTKPVQSPPSERDPGWVRALSPAEVAALGAQEVRALTAEEVRYMYRDQIEALRAEQICAFTAEQLASFDQQPLVMWLTPAQAAWMSRDQAHVLLGEVGKLDYSHQVKHLDPAVLKTLQDVLADEDAPAESES